MSAPTNAPAEAGEFRTLTRDIIKQNLKRQRLEQILTAGDRVKVLGGYRRSDAAPVASVASWPVRLLEGLCRFLLLALVIGLFAAACHWAIGPQEAAQSAMWGGH